MQGTGWGWGNTAGVTTAGVTTAGVTAGVTTGLTTGLTTGVTTWLLTVVTTWLLPVVTAGETGIDPACPVTIVVLVWVVVVMVPLTHFPFERTNPS